MLNKLKRTVYAFGSPCDTIYAKLVFKADGTIYGYSHPNEKYWRLEDDELLLISQDGDITSRYKSDGMNNWIGHLEGKKWPMFLNALLVLDDVDNINKFPSIFVNTIPKAGTYYVESALESLGFLSTNLHLLNNNIVDDYRRLAKENIHKRPSDVRLLCPVELVTQLLVGEQIVGHVEYFDIIQKIREQNICVLSIVRNLREVLVSLYRFKQNKVAPTDYGDKFWRNVDKSNRISAFLLYYHEKDLEHIRVIARSMLDDKQSILLRYEEMLDGIISPKAAEYLNSFYPDLSQKLSEALVAVKDKDTPTYSGKRSDWKVLWNDDVERYFVESGMYELNKKLGYED